MNKEKLEELLANEKFVRKLISLETGEQVRGVLYKKGVKLRPEDMEDFAKAIIYVLEHQGNKKLDNCELENVSGGTTELTENQKEFKSLAETIVNKFDEPLNLKNILWLK